MTEGLERRTTLLFVSLLDVSLLALGHAYNSHVLIGGALVLFSAAVIFSRRGDFLPLMMFYLPWAPVLKTDPSSFTFTTLVVPVFFFLILFEGLTQEHRFKVRTIIPAIFLTAYTLWVKLFNALPLHLPYLFFILMLFFLPLYLSQYKQDIRFERCVLFLTAGVLSACVVAKILMHYPHMVQYIAVDQSEQIGLLRLSGFYGDPNYYSAQILVTIAGMMIVMSKTKKGGLILLQSTSMIALLYFGMLSGSKMFLLCSAGLLVLWMFNLLIEKGRMSYRFGVILSVAIAVGVAASTQLFSDQINLYLMRFRRVSDTHSLTSGRSDLWGVYLNYLFSNIDKLLWGIGLSEDQVRILLKTNNAHNTLIEINYQLGVAGGLLLLWWWKGIYEEISNRAKMNLPNGVLFSIMLSSVFLPWFALDMLYFHEFFYYVLLLFFSKVYLSMETQDIGDLSSYQHLGGIPL